MSYEQEITFLAKDYNDANDTEFYDYEDRMKMVKTTKWRMENVAIKFGKTYREVLNDIRAIA